MNKLGKYWQKIKNGISFVTQWWFIWTTVFFNFKRILSKKQIINLIYIFSTSWILLLLFEFISIFFFIGLKSLLVFKSSVNRIEFFQYHCRNDAIEIQFLNLLIEKYILIFPIEKIFNNRHFHYVLLHFQQLQQ